MSRYLVWTLSDSPENGRIIFQHDAASAAAYFGRAVDFESTEFAIANGGWLRVWVQLQEFGGTKSTPEIYEITAETKPVYSGRKVGA